ncbi:MAG: amidase [Cytophagales bacterium]|nr:amidase [Cytophagales bacterium]
MARIVFKSASELAAMIRNKEISSFELTKQFLEQIDDLNPRLQAIVYNRAEDALREAQEADQLLENGELKGRLHGVPFTVKESFEIADIPTTLNAYKLRNNIAKRNSSVVEKIKDEGGILLGKTNVPTYLADIQTAGQLFSTAINPHDETRTTGGSSGGSACAVSAGMSGFCIGTDMDGSLRLPAHFCGVYTLKPTYGAIPLNGHLIPVSDVRSRIELLQSTGPVARSLQDLELVFSIMQQTHPELLLAQSYKSSNRLRPFEEYRVSFSTNLGRYHTSYATAQAMNELFENLRLEGVSCIPDRPKVSISRMLDLWAELLGFTLSQGLSYWKRKKMTYSLRNHKTLGELGRKISNGFTNDFNQFANSLRIRELMVNTFEAFFQEYDFWICPVAMGQAFEHCRPGSEIRLEHAHIPYYHYSTPFNCIANLTGIPSLVVPVKKLQDGMPIGIQIMGRYGSERQLFDFAKQLEKFVMGYSIPNLLDVDRAIYTEDELNYK